ncbi:hypothetical protein ACJX0J_001351 (mitochondrion) [Zea mays]
MIGITGSTLPFVGASFRKLELIAVAKYFTSSEEDASLKEGRYVAVEDAGTLYRGFHSHSVSAIQYFLNELTRSLLEITQTVPMIVVGILHLILMDIALAFRKGNPIDLARDTRICRDRKQPFFPTGQGRRLEILPVLDISLPI